MLDLLAQNEFSQEFAATIEEQVMQKYGDILYQEHPVSANHLPMSVDNRAAQFSPFAALTSHGEVIKETARTVEMPVELDEDRLCELDNIFKYIEMSVQKNNSVDAQFTYYESDAKKSGGHYRIAEGKVKKIDEINRQIILEDERIISLEEIINIKIKMEE